MSNIIATNRKAAFNYTLLDRIEAGIELKGAEVKSIRNKHVSFTDGFIRIFNGEAFVYGMHISPYKQSGQFAPEPERARKLLLRKSQIHKFIALSAQKGFSIVATKLYFKNGKVKLEIAIGRGKRFFDKREKIRKRHTDREVQRSLKSRKR